MKLSQGLAVDPARRTGGSANRVATDGVYEPGRPMTTGDRIGQRPRVLCRERDFIRCVQRPVLPIRRKWSEIGNKRRDGSCCIVPTAQMTRRLNCTSRRHVPDTVFLSSEGHRMYKRVCPPIVGYEAYEHDWQVANSAWDVPGPRLLEQIPCAGLPRVDGMQYVGRF